MITSAELIELQKLINGEHGDPHHILGMHSLLFKNVHILTVRVYIPQAASIYAYDPLIPDKHYPLEKVHADGFFEGRIEDRIEWFRYMLHIQGADGSEWSTYDPYSFYPTVSEMDRYLFSEGTHYEIFNKLGAHLTEMEGISGAVFSVWVPTAARVSVVGAFNCWDGRRHQMRNPSGSGVWEIFIPGLCELDEYKFEIKTKKGEFIQKSDPYGFYFLPNPGTQSVLFDIDKYEWGDSEWQSRTQKESEPINIYEAHIGSWRRPATYAAAADSMIDYVKNLGYTHIELLPIQEHSSLSSLGYQVTGYYAPTSRYGTPDELKRFIDLCHRKGIGVILDWVPTHFPQDSHSLANFNGGALYEREGVRTVWNTNMFDYSKKEVKNFLLGNALFWIEKYHIDGLRINNLKNLGCDTGAEPGAVEFLKHLNSIIKNRHPETLMIAEDIGALNGVTQPVESGGLGFNLVWNPHWTENLLTYMTSEPSRRLNQQIRIKFEHCFEFIPEKTVIAISHDESAYGKSSLYDRLPGNDEEKMSSLRLALAFMIGCPGGKLIFMGLEFAHNEPWDIVKGLNWDIAKEKRNKAMLKFVKDLNDFYSKDQPLWEHVKHVKEDQPEPESGITDFLDEGRLCLISTKPGIFAFMRKDSRNEITVFVCNFTCKAYDEYMLSVPYGGTYREIINSDFKIYGGKSVAKQKLTASRLKDNFGGHSLILKLPALSAVILKPAKKRKTE